MYSWGFCSPMFTSRHWGPLHGSLFGVSEATTQTTMPCKVGCLGSAATTQNDPATAAPVEKMEISSAKMGCFQ